MKKTSNHNQLIMIIMAIGIIVLVIWGFTYYVSRQPLIPATADASYNYYAKYLQYSSGQEEDIEIFLDPVSGSEDFNWYISIYNKTDKFYCGRLKLYNENKELIFDQLYVNIRPQEVRMIALELATRPVDYKLSENKFFSFTYPKPEMTVSESKDSDPQDVYVWNNLVFNSEDCKPEACLEYAKYLYVEDVLAGMDFPDTYCYDRSDTTYTEVSGVSYPEIECAKFTVIYDANTKIMRVVDNIAGQEVLLEETMR